MNICNVTKCFNPLLNQLLTQRSEVSHGILTILRGKQEVWSRMVGKFSNTMRFCINLDG